MYDAAAQTYDDEEFVSVKASSDERLSELADIDMCFHTSLLPNARSKESNTITYLGEDSEDASTSWTVPLPYDWCLNDGTEEWSSSFPGGNVYPAPSSFVGSNAYKGYPMFPPSPETSTLPLQVTPAGNLTSTLSAEDMSPPFGGVPTAVQISTASSSTVGYLSEDAVSYFAQYMSLIRAGLESSSSYTIEQKAELTELLDKTQEIMWETGVLANAATNSAWTKSNPIDMPPALSYWFTDGGYTDGPASAIALARHQKTYGTGQEIKLIISNNNYITDNMNNVLAYFNTTWNSNTDPGDFIWPAGVGSEPQYNPQRSNQIFKETMTEDS